MSEKRQLVAKQVGELVAPIVEEMGFELVDLEYVFEHGKWILRIYMDGKGFGVTLDDCARVSRELGDLIDVKDIIPHTYLLEVSSPGLNRPLKQERDFVRVLGKKVKLKTTSPIHGRQNFTGYLEDFQAGTLFVRVDKTVLCLPLNSVKKANLVYEFGEG